MVTPREGMLALLLAFVLAGCDDLKERGRINLELGDWNRAERCFAQAVDEDPDDLEARLGLGKALLQKAQGLAADHRDKAADWDLAVRELSVATASKSDSEVSEALYQARVRAARSWAREGDTSVALGRLEGLRLASPEQTGARNIEAILRFRRGEYEKATALFEENHSIDSSDVSACYNLGLLYWHQGKLDRSALYLLKAARLAPQDAEIIYWLGKVSGGGS
ncbi:MAG: hypothetical protein RL318_2396 [Fibrobacterota bacterium]